MASSTGNGNNTPLGNLVVNLSLEGSQFSNSLQGIRGDLRLAQSAMRANLSVLGEAGNEYNKLSQHIEDLGKVMQANQRQIDELKRKHQQMIDTYGEESEEARRYAVQINRVIAQQGNFQRQLEASRRALSELNNQDTKKLQKQLREVEVHLGRLREHAEEVSQSLATIAVPAAAFTGMATAAATEMDKVKGLLGAGLGISPEEAAAAGKASGKIYAEGYGESVEEVAESFKLVQQFMKLSGQEAEKATKLAMAYAESTGDDVQEALRGADALMKHYGMSAEEAFDYMVTGAQNGLNKSRELSDNTAEYAQLFKEGGYSASEMFSILESGLSAGAYNLDKVNDFVKEFGIRLIDGNFEKKMGFLSKETQGLFKSFKQGKATTADVFKSFQVDLQKMGDNSNDTKKKIADMFGGLGEDNALQVIQGLSSVSKSFEDVGGASESAAKSLRDTNISNVKEGWRELQLAIQPVGEDILEFAGDVLPKVASGAKVVSGWFKDLGDKGKIISLSIAGLGVVAPVVAAVMVVLAGALASFGSAIAGIAASGILSTIVGALSSFAAIAAGVVIAVGAIIAVFVDLWKTSDRFRDVIRGLVLGIKEFASNVKDLFAGSISNLVNLFKEHLLPTIKEFYLFIKDSIIVVLERLKKFWDENSDSIFGFISVLKIVADFLANVFAPIFGAAFKAIFWLVKGYVQNIVNIVMAIIDIFSGVIKFISGIFTGDLGRAMEGIKEIFRGAFVIILNLLSIFFVGKILGVVKVFAGKLGSMISSLWKNVTGFFSKGLDKTKSLVQSAKNKIVDIFGLMGTAVIRKFDDMVTTAKRVPQKILAGFTSMKGKLVDKMRDIGSSMKNALIGGLNGMIDGVNWVLSKLGLSNHKITRISTTNNTAPRSSRAGGGGGSVPEYHNGTHHHPGGLAIVNDAKSSKYREAVILPDGKVVVPEGKDVMMNLPKGSQVIPGYATPDFLKMMNIPKYEKGTGLWGKIKDMGEGVWDALTDPISFFKKMISKIGDFTSGLSGLPSKMAKSSFNFTADKATEWFKKVMNSDDAQSKGHGGPAMVTSGNTSGKWGVATELLTLANKIMPRFKQSVITSGLRPGARTAGGTLSDHGTGKALDISGYGRNGSPMYKAIAEQFYNSPYVKYVIANDMWKWKGRFDWKKYPWGGHMNHAHISAFANGGIVDSATLGVFGEAGKEALIPLSSARKTRGVQLLNEAASHLGKRVTDGGTVSREEFNQVISLLQVQAELLASIAAKSTDIYIDKAKVGKQVASTVKEEIDKIDKRDKRSRGLTS